MSYLIATIIHGEDSQVLDSIKYIDTINIVQNNNTINIINILSDTLELNDTNYITITING